MLAQVIRFDSALFSDGVFVRGAQSNVDFGYTYLTGLVL